MRRRDPLITEVADAMLNGALGDAICYDELLGRICVYGQLPWEDSKQSAMRPWASTDDSAGYAYAQEVFDCGSERDFQHALTIAASKRQVNPIINLMEALPEWDGIKRVGNLMQTFLGAANDDYTTEVERLLMGAALARTFDPGCKFDYMPVLIGHQGIGKSTFIRKLALDAKYFTDSVCGIGSKQAAELVQGKWFVELPELAAMKGATLEAVKAFITRQADEYRMPYARHVESRPRRFVLVGTTNVREFLTDLTGNRRFLPIKCGEQKPEMSLFSAEADCCFRQAWSEAYREYREGALGRSWQLVLSRSASERALELQANSGIDDPRVGIIEQWILGLEAGTLICTVQVIEQALGIAREMQKRHDQMEVSSLLQNAVAGIEPLEGKHRVGAYGVQRAYQVTGGQSSVANVATFCP